MKDYYIPTFGEVETVGELVGQDIFAVVKIGFHGTAVDLMWLKKKNVDNGKDG